jgi:hypothetical protein
MPISSVSRLPGVPMKTRNLVIRAFDAATDAEKLSSI